jgi:DNA-binding transcriptional MerR regulator
MRIGELSELTGVPARLLRYYEQQGLLRPDRDVRGWRTYDDSDRERIGEIRTLIEAGLPTAAIVRLLDGNRPSAPDETLLVELAAVHDRLDARIRCLARNRDALAAWLRTAQAGSSANGSS